MESDDAEEDEDQYDIVLLKEFEQHTNGTSNCTICSLAISSDSQWLASGDTNNNIYVFNLDALLKNIFFFFFLNFTT